MKNENKLYFKNIIFDFGGVVIDIDYRLTIAAFHALGVKNFEEQYSKLKQSHLFDKLEKGIISTSGFYDRIRTVSGLPLTDEEINRAWNAIILDLPRENINFLEELKDQYRLFLLSNTNEIHEQAFTELIRKKFGGDVLSNVFEKVYFSHRLNMRKPDTEIFRHVLDENNLVAAETLFVDDSWQHIEGARAAGLRTFYFDEGKTLQDVLTSL